MANFVDDAAAAAMGEELNMQNNIDIEGDEPIGVAFGGEVVTEADNVNALQLKIRKSFRDLGVFLGTAEIATEKRDPATNIINLYSGKTYNISPKYQEEFFTHLEKCRQDNMTMHYLERVYTTDLTHSGIMLDFDHKQRVKEPVILDRHLNDLVRLITKALVDVVDFRATTHADEYKYHIFIIKRPAITEIAAGAANEPPMYKDGFHILIPEIQVTKELKRHFIDYLIKQHVFERAFASIDGIGDANKMIDMNSAHVPVHLLGHCKLNKLPYGLSHIFEINMRSEDGDVEIQRREVPLLEIAARKHNLTYELSLSFYLRTIGGQPTWLNKQRFEHHPTLAAYIRDQTAIIAAKQENTPFDDILRMNVENDNELNSPIFGDPRNKNLRALLAMLDDSYAQEYNKWFRVLCVIAHCGGDKMRPFAEEFSKRTHTIDSRFYITWDSIIASKPIGQPLTILSLHQWARKCSPQRYDEFKRQDFETYLWNAIIEHNGNLEHAPISKLIHMMWHTQFIVSKSDAKSIRQFYKWYEYVLPGREMNKGEVYKWRSELRPVNLQLYIADDLPNVFKGIKLKITREREKALTNDDTKWWLNLERSFARLCTKLGNNTFQDGIIKQAEHRFYVRDFEDKLDSYPDIIGVGNGILKIGAEPELITGFHEYRISKFTETDYVPYNPENPHIQRLERAFSEIYPELDVLNFMLMHAATGLDMRDARGLLVIGVGGGQNGKSFFSKMVTETLGKHYATNGQSAFWTSPMPRSGAPDESLMQFNGMRYIVFDEFERSEVLTNGRLKSTVDPRKQSGRGLYQHNAVQTNTVNPILLSNYDFIIETTDHGTWRRIYYYKNKVKFCENPDPNNKFERKCDRRMYYEWPNDNNYKMAMLSILVHYYQRLCREYGGDIAAVPVPTISRETTVFRSRQDVLDRFLNQMIVRSPSSIIPINIHKIVQKYVEYRRQNNISRDVQLNVDDVIAQLENSRIGGLLAPGPSGQKVLNGYRMKQSIDEDLLADETPLDAAVHIVLNEKEREDMAENRKAREDAVTAAAMPKKQATHGKPAAVDQLPIFPVAAK